MGKLRFLFALWMAKLSIPALKITRHNGTDFPGSLAVKLCPDFLKYIGKPEHIIAVTGTNGKTTVANMLNDVLTAEGKTALSNRAGSNIISGVSTALLKGCGLLGRIRPEYDLAILEIDEPLRAQDLSLCEAGAHRHHQPVPGLHHAERPSGLHRGHPDPVPA